MASGFAAVYAACFVAVWIALAEGALIPSAFTVAQNSHIHVTNASVIPFNTVITWRHSRQWQDSAGVFICDKQGLYKFQVYSLTKTDQRLWLELYHNNQLVVSLWGHTPTDYADTGNAAILDLAVGDQVYVRSRDQYDVNLYGTTSEIYTTFSGVFIGHELSGSQQASQSAFSVALDHPMNLTGGSTVLYNKVILDVAYAFDTTTGVYTAPSEGVYVFHFFSMGSPGTEMYQELYHEGNYVCSIYNYQWNEGSGAGNTVILHLNANDQMKVVAESATNNSLLGAADEIYTTFSGVQISQTKDNAGSPTGTGSLVAFSVGISSNFKVLKGATVKFDRVFINLPKAFDVATGIFTAPVSGTYEFNFHVLGDTSEWIWLELYHNSRYVDALYSHEPSTYSAAGNSAVLQLDVGDVVFVSNHRGSDAYDEELYGAHDEVYCTFSGYLVSLSSSGLDIVG